MGRKLPREPGIPVSERSAPPASIEEAMNAMTLVEAADRVGLTKGTLREAIRRGDLVAFIPRGRDPLRAGPGIGYRITATELERWYLGGKS